MEYDSAIKKKNEILPSATTWLDLEGIMLNERQMPDDFTYVCNLKKQDKTKQKA